MELYVHPEYALQSIILDVARISRRILQHMISGFPLLLDLIARMQDPYDYVVFWAPTLRNSIGARKDPGTLAKETFRRDMRAIRAPATWGVLYGFAKQRPFMHGPLFCMGSWQLCDSDVVVESLSCPLGAFSFWV